MHLGFRDGEGSTWRMGSIAVTVANAALDKVQGWQLDVCSDTKAQAGCSTLQLNIWDVRKLPSTCS
jgi:hypothetical protein